MATDIVIPSVGESVTTGVIARWSKQDGEFVKRDEPVLELETDKVTMEVPAPATGVLRTGASVGDEVKIGAVVGRVEESDRQPAAVAAKQAAGASEEGGRTPGIQPRPEAEVAQPVHREGIEDRENASAAGAHAAEEVRATPLAKKMAQERGIDLSRITGTGAAGRVREQDVVAYAQSRAAAAPPAQPRPDRATPVQPGPSAPSPDGRASTRERMSPLRQRVATRLVQAQHTAAMLTTFNECDMTAVMALRKQFKEDFEKRHGVGLGFMSFFVKAAAAALQAYPTVNAFIVDDESGQPAIEKHSYCDIALAVASPKGLVVPVLRNCEQLSFARVESGVKDLAVRARDGKLTLEEMQGGTFTITNGGIFGSLNSTPILNPPQSAILGMHAIKNRAVEHPAGSGQVAIRPMMYLALSYDHRIIDGAEAVRFLVKIKEGIEDPSRLLLGL